MMMMMIVSNQSQNFQLLLLGTDVTLGLTSHGRIATSGAPLPALNGEMIRSGRRQRREYGVKVMSRMTQLM